jgi:hypothetical protein
MGVVSKCSECGRPVETTIARDDILCVSCVGVLADWATFDEEERTLKRAAPPLPPDRPPPRRRTSTSKP